MKKPNLPKTLFIGYGNPDREDDGVAWHVLSSLADKMSLLLPENYLDCIYPSGEQNPDLLFCLQLTPELSELIKEYQLVYFIDAHTGNIPEDIQFKPVKPIFQKSPLTHHMTPETCLSFTKTIYDYAPNSILVSIRGYQFDFVEQLSEKTKTLADKAVNQIIESLDSP